MRRIFIMLSVLTALLILNTGQRGFSQVVLEENFSYSVGTALSANGWTVHSSGINPITVSSPTISYTGYLSSGIGNEVTVANTGEDVHKTFTSQTSGSIYAGYLVHFTSASTTGDYYCHLGQSTISTTFRGRIFVKRDASSNLAFGISFATGTPVYSTFSYSLNTTYLIIVKYTIVTGTNNDQVSLFIDPVLGGSEPLPTLTATDVNSDLSDVGSIALRQGGTSSGSNQKVDGIRVGLTWLDVAGTGTITAPTIQTSEITFANILQTQMDVAWTNGDGAKRIVKINTSNSFTNPADGTDPTASTVYGGSGEQVVYNGSGTSIPTVTGLSTATTYWFKAWEYNGTGTGTVYCTLTGTNNPNSQTTAAAATAPVISSPTATAITATGATLGGDITADGGSSILERGTVWSLTPGVTITDNKLAEGGTTTGVFTHARTGMPSNTPIYYAAYATNSVGTTLTTEATFTTLLGEPTNHASGFSAVSPTYSSVTNTWSDNDGTQPATGFLILANTTGIFTDPVNGVPVVNDYTLSDGSGAANVNHGVQTFSWYNLLSSTPYYFKIYAFTNSGSNITYKLVPSAPEANVTTLVFDNPVATWTFDSTWAAPNTPLTVVANFGDQSGTATLYADGTNSSTAWAIVNPGFELTMFAGSTVNDPREGAAIYAGGAYSPVGGPDTSANGNMMIIKFSMSALQDPILTFATRGTSTGFNTHQWAWSTDGMNFTDFGTNTANQTSTFLTKTLDMTSIDQLDGAPVVYLRITFTGATSQTGNNRLDNIVIRATDAYSLPPTVFTLPATNVDTHVATINGTVNANNQSSTVKFAYGTTTAYGDTTAAVPATVEGGLTTPVSLNLSNLMMNTMYHYKVLATNNSGTSAGEDMTFITTCPLPDPAGDISGPSTVCGSIGFYTFTVPEIPNATSYIWSFPAGTEIISGFDNDTIIVALTTSGDISVFGTNECGDGDASSPFAVTVIEPVDVSVTIVASANPVDEGTPVTFTATPVNGGTSPAFQWNVNNSNVGTNDAQYTYVPADGDVIYCTLTSSETCAWNNPAGSNTITMEVNSIVPVTLNVQNVTLTSGMTECYNALETITVAGSGTTFEVQNGASATFIAGLNVIFLPGTTVLEGGYMHAYISTTFCGGMTPPMVSAPMGTGSSMQSLSGNTFRVYPNPTPGKLTIESTDGATAIGTVEIFNMTGKKVGSMNGLNHHTIELDLHGQPEGIYFTRISAGTEVSTVKVILNK